MSAPCSAQDAADADEARGGQYQRLCFMLAERFHDSHEGLCSLVTPLAHVYLQQRW